MIKTQSMDATPFEPKPLESLLVLLGNLSLSYFNVNQPYDTLLKDIRYREGETIPKEIRFWCGFTPPIDLKALALELSEHLKSLIPEVKIQVDVEIPEEYINENQIWGDFHLLLAEPESIPELLLTLLSRPHRIVGMYRHQNVLLLTDLDVLTCADNPAFDSYCQSQGWTPNRIYHYFLNRSGQKVSPRWIIEYLLDTKDLPKYQVFDYKDLLPDIVYRHTQDSIALMKDLYIPIIDDSKRGRRSEIGA